MPPRPSNSPSSYRPPTVVALVVISVFLPQPREPFSAIWHPSVKWLPPCGLVPGLRDAPAGYVSQHSRRKVPPSRPTRVRFAAQPSKRTKKLLAGSDSFVVCGGSRCGAAVAMSDRKLVQWSERAACHSAASITARAIGAASRPPAMSFRGMLASSTITATATFAFPAGANEVNHANGLRLGSD
jgi:hypothetical protein